MYGKWAEMEGCLLVIGRSSQEYESIHQMANKWANAAEKDEMKSTLKEAEEMMQKNGTCFKNLALLSNYSQGCLFVQTSRIKK